MATASLRTTAAAPSTAASSTSRLPVLFIGHGSPMNAISDNEYTRSWFNLTTTFPKPAAILCVSAHWETDGTTATTGNPRPRTIHDFGGFPPALRQFQYPAPGSPTLATRVVDLLRADGISSATVSTAWGFDHGCWGVLCKMFPDADIPVIQLSLDRRLTAAEHYAMGRRLRPLRDEGVLIVASGGVVHNLGMLDFTESRVFDWAVEFDNRIKGFILSGDDDSVIQYDRLGSIAKLAVPTPEHFLPLLYALGARDEHDSVRVFNAGIMHGSVGMLSAAYSPSRYPPKTDL